MTNISGTTIQNQLRFLLVIIIAGAFAFPLISQSSLSTQQQLQIDSLFLEFENTDGPGLSFGLLKDGEIIYTRNIGLADIEKNTPITSQTSFQLGDLSRHFTAYAAILLEKEGKLDLNEPVIKYLPDLKIPASIRVINLLQHSSGLNEFHTVKTLAGWYHERPYNQSDALDIIQLQKRLRFEPGTDFNYSESNFIVLTAVIESVSRKDLGSFMNEQVFTPMGMVNTAYKNDSLPLPNIAKGYELEDGVQNHIELHNHTLGVHNLYSSVEDMLRWEWHVMHPAPKDKDIIRRLKSIIQLESGREFNIPQGKLRIAQHFTHKERGIPKDYLTSRMGPYTSAMFNFPDHDLIGVVLSNNNMPYNGHLVMISASILLEDEFTEPAIAFINTKNAPTLSTAQLEKYAGSYFDPEFALLRSITVTNDTLKYVRSNGFATALIPIDKDQFQLPLGSDDKVVIDFKTVDDQFIMDYIIGEAEPISLIKYEPWTPQSSNLEEYTGTYFSKSLGIAYNVVIVDNALIVSSPINGRSNLAPVSTDLFTSDHYFMRSLFFNRNPAQHVDGFLVRHSGAWNVWFEKLS